MQKRLPVSRREASLPESKKKMMNRVVLAPVD
jgi:hypothetical protein